jgi:arylsulfatase A-like enzyme
VYERSEITRRALLRGAALVGAGVALQTAGTGALARELGATRGSDGGASRQRPNVIVVMADDMRADEAPYMPNLQRLLVDRGTSFTAARHNISLCSPARAGFLTGQLSKRHGIRSQRDSFRRNNDVEQTLPVWMQAAGYHTAIIGKYFTSLEGKSTPPGWDRRRQLADRGQEERGYRVWDGERLLAPRLAQTPYLRREVVDYLEAAPEPFFLWFTPTANHSPFQTPPGYGGDLADVQWPDGRETDVADKPAWVQSLPPLSDEVLASIREAQQVRLRELLGLDDTLAAMVRTLRARAALADTVIMFSSDNGLLWGEHRIPPGSKNLAYEPSVHVPCVVRGPGFPATTIDEPVHMAMDLTATCVSLARARPGHALDGVSLTEVVADPQGFDDRELLYDRDDRDGFPFPPPGSTPAPPADGIFTRNRKLIRSRESPAVYELYDLDVDPDELQNVADDPAYANDRAALEAALDRLLAG